VEPSELRYRSLLATAYWELTKDLDVLYIFYQQNESCIAMAATPEEVREVDHGLVLAGPYRDDLGSLVLKMLRLIRKTAVLHTPAYFAASELEGFEEAARGREIRYAVRETPGEITYYRLANGEVEVMGAKRLSPYEQLIIRMYEAEHA
jgi:hypothetical protein